MEHVVLCPGSRSGPLALAAGELSNSKRIELTTTIDERSAAFFALGLGTASGIASAVITTSGSAVAHLLPAAIEADRSSQPILFLTADRPARLKDCGSNQTVNQEDFLIPTCRLFEQGPFAGIHLLSLNELDELVERVWTKAHQFPGPVHLNIPLEEPLHASLLEQEHVFRNVSNEYQKLKIKGTNSLQVSYNEGNSKFLPILDSEVPGVVIVGPWRGKSQKLIPFQQALKEWQAHTNWPIFADPLSGLSQDQPGLISNWELLISSGFLRPKGNLQVLRLGPMPASRSLEEWLLSIGSKQLLITEGDPRTLDPLGISCQWSDGFVQWLRRMQKGRFLSNDFKTVKSNLFLNFCSQKDSIADCWLDDQLPLKGAINEPALARWLPRLLPTGIPIMLAASSPVRDWLAFSGKDAFKRRCFGFRGASGIDGTLSLGMGLSRSLGSTVLITGDLALLHDSNGWLFSHAQRVPLVVLLIDNGGGGIFKQLNLHTESVEAFKELFVMPQLVDPLALADAHGIPYRQVTCFEDLQASFDWGFAQSVPVLIRVCTNSSLDAVKRFDIRTQLNQHLHVHSK